MNKLWPFWHIAYHRLITTCRKALRLINYDHFDTLHIIGWQLERHKCCPPMFHWEPKGGYCHRLFTKIVPFWLSTEQLWTALTPFWHSADDINDLSHNDSGWCKVNPSYIHPFNNFYSAFSSGCKVRLKAAKIMFSMTKFHFGNSVWRLLLIQWPYF